MLANLPNKRPTRVHPQHTNNGGDIHNNNGVDNEHHDSFTRTLLAPDHQQSHHSFTGSSSSSSSASSSTQNHLRPSAAALARQKFSLWRFMRNNFGVKSSITLILFLILGILILRHEFRIRAIRQNFLDRQRMEAERSIVESNHEEEVGGENTTPTLQQPSTTNPLPSDKHTPILELHPEVLPASSPSSTKPAHVHPPAYAWDHESVLPERRPSNFALNGLHAQYNEEKIRSLFERPRVAGLETPGLVTSFLSPNQAVKMSILMSEEGRLGYMLEVLKNKEMIGSSNAIFVPLISPSFTELNANFASCAFRTDNTFGAEVVWALESGESYWRPVPGNERRYFDSRYTQVKVWCIGEQCTGCSFVWEFRLYNEAAAIRAVVNGESITNVDQHSSQQSDPESEYIRLDYGMEVRLPSPDNEVHSTCYGQNHEEPYSVKPCTSLNETIMTPITIKLEPFSSKELEKGQKPFPLPYRYLSLLQADGPAFMRSTVQTSMTHNDTLNIITRGELPLHGLQHQLGVIEHDILGYATPTSWNVIMLGESSGELIQREYLIYLLCPPPSSRFPMTMDGRWVSIGKSLRTRGHTTAKAKYLIDFAATYNYQLIHFDAGWYGDEHNKSSDPRRVDPKYADLNIQEVSNYGRIRGIGVTVYVNEIVLKDTYDLIETYPKWNLHGIKFGFVDVNSPRAMRLLHQRMLAYQHIGMSVNIHDMYRPRGLSRTYPHLITQEGVRGEERKPDATHHTILPFVRYLQGSADYTPRYLKGMLRCTRAHQLALPLILFSPIQSLFWAEPGQAIVEAVQLYNPELVMWQLLPTVWDDTRVLNGEIGEYVSIARRSGQDWFVGAITNTVGREVTLNLSTLFDNTYDGMSHPLPFTDVPTNKKGYMIHLYEDDHAYKIDRSGGGVTGFDDTLNNNVRVKLRQLFILPAKYSTDIDRMTRELVAQKVSPFPSDPTPTQYVGVSEFRSRVVAGQEKQLTNMYTKETGKGIPSPKTLESPIFKIKLAPSGGAVIYVTPIV